MIFKNRRRERDTDYERFRVLVAAMLENAMSDGAYLLRKGMWVDDPDELDDPVTVPLAPGGSKLGSVLADERSFWCGGGVEALLGVAVGLGILRVSRREFVQGVKRYAEESDGFVTTRRGAVDGRVVN